MSLPFYQSTNEKITKCDALAHALAQRLRQDE
jgi:hypothetical protein